MKYDTDKIDDATLALLTLTMFKESYEVRAWKSFDWDTLDRLHSKGFISDPKSKAKSVVVTKEGEQRAEELFDKMFGLSDDKD